MSNSSSPPSIKDISSSSSLNGSIFLSNSKIPTLLNKNSRDPFFPSSPLYLLKIARMLATVLLMLSVVHSIKNPIPPGP